jgi:hypothetical protein
MLPEASDLPGINWMTVDTRTWLMGIVGPVTERAIRAREAKCVSASRSFEQLNESRWLVAQVKPFANEADAAADLADPTFIKNPRFTRYKMTVTDGREASDVTVPGSSATRAYEQEVTGRIGDGVNKRVMGTVGPVLFNVVASAWGKATWKWDEVVPVATKIVERINQSLG